MQLMTVDLIEASHGLDVLAFTSNAVLTSHPSRLVMGAGAAKAVRDSFDGVDRKLAIEIGGSPGLVNDYYIASCPSGYGLDICAVQVKRHWRDMGDIELCKESLLKFAEWLDGRSAAINMPLVGFGGYRGREDEIIELLEVTIGNSNVIVCSLSTNHD